MLHKKLCAGTIVQRLVRMEISPLEAAFTRPFKSSQHTSHDDVVDILNDLMINEHFIKQWSEPYILTVMITKSF